MTKVIWSKNATNELLKICAYWTKRNNSTAYSKKIKFHVKLAINLIKENNQLGVKSNIENIRMRLVLKNYYLIYNITANEIRILQFWDVRQSPLKIKLSKE